MAERKPFGFSTLAVHGGETRPKPTHALATPIVQTATYTWANSQEVKDHFDGKIHRIDYGRYGNPTQRMAEEKLVDAGAVSAGDLIVVTVGEPIGQPGGTNTLKIIKVGER